MNKYIGIVRKPIGGIENQIAAKISNKNMLDLPAILNFPLQNLQVKVLPGPKPNF